MGSKMAQKVKVFATKPDDLSFIYTWWVKNNSCKMSSNLHLCVCKHIHTQNK